MIDRGLDHVPQFVFVLRRHDRHIGQAAQVGEIEDAVMGAAVVPGEPGAIHREDDRQTLHADIVNDLIVGALQKGRIDRADRSHALRWRDRRRR